MKTVAHSVFRSALLWCWLALPLRAALISYENFDYPAPQALGARNGGTGWGAAWTGGGMVVTPGLSQAGLAVSGNAMRPTGNHTASLRALTAAGFPELRTGGRWGLDGTELWFSFLIRREPELGLNAYGGVSLFNASTEEIFIGLPTGATHWSFQQFDLGAAPGNVTAAANAPVVTGEITRLVLRLRFGAHGTQDQVDLFVNPALGVTPTVSDATRVGADLQFDRVRVQSGPAGITGGVTVDEIWLGETYADVTPFLPGPSLSWRVPGPQRVTAGAELTLPLAFAWPDGDPATLAFAVTAEDTALMPADRITITGTGTRREVTLRPPAGAGGQTVLTATLTPPGGSPVHQTLELQILPTPPEGLLAYESFDYAPAGTPLVGKAGGTGFSSAWVAGIPGTAGGNSFIVGNTRLSYPGIATQGLSTRLDFAFAQAMQRPTTDLLGEDNTVRYASLLVRADAAPTATGYFGLLALGSQGLNLFAGKPGGGQTARFVLEDGGGARQVASAWDVVSGETVLLVLKLEFHPGNDRLSLFVNPPLGEEPAVPDAVKEDLDLGLVSGMALNSAHPWSADELRLGTTYASVTPVGEPEAGLELDAIAPVDGIEHTPLTLQVTTVHPLPVGRMLAFELIGENFGAAVDEVTGDFAWTPGELDGGETRQFTVRATSDATPPETGEVRFTITVAEQNAPPQLADPGSLVVEEGTPLSLQLVATDADEPPQELVFSLISGPEGLAVSDSGLVTWTPAPAQWDHVFEATVQVHEGLGGSDARTFTITSRSTGSGGGPPPPLFAVQAGDEVVLTWENLAGTFALQVASDLESAPWLDLAVAPVLSDGLNHVARPVTNTTEYFRLVSRNEGGSRLTGATPRAGTLGPGAMLFVGLNFSGPPAPDDLLEVTETFSGLSRERRIPAEFLLQPDGSLGFFLNGDDAPFGTPRVTMRLVSSTGAGRGLVTFDIPNLPPDTGGEPPSLGSVIWCPPSGAARRPFNNLATVRPQLSLGMNDPDGDLTRVELVFTDPAGTTFGRIVPVRQTGADPLDLVLYPLSFGRDSAEGDWEVQVTVFDRAGHSSGPRAARLNFGDEVPPSAAAAPLIHNVSPQTGVPGDVVEITVGNVPDLSPTNARVRIGGRMAQVVGAANNFLLRVVVPTGTAGGRVELTVPQGTAIGPAAFVVSAAPNVEPAVAHALAGQALQFRLDRPLDADAVVAWSVTGGGSIDANGLFRAPDHFTQPGEVTVTAHITRPGGSDTATALVTIEAAPVARGSDLLVAATGGVVWSQNLLARAEVPPGALASDTVISVSVPAQDARPTPPAGSELLGLVEIGPDDAQFSTAMGVLMPLVRSLPPGESLPLRRWNPADGAWVDEGLSAIVEPDGQSARAAVSRFSLYGLIAPATGQSPAANRMARQAAGIRPQITAVTPAFIHEGELRPIHLEGSGLDGAVELAVVLDNGSPMPGLALGPLVRARLDAVTEDGTRAGFLLDAPVLPALGEGQNLALRIRLRKAGHPDALFPLQLRGLPEFNAADLAGPLPPDHRFTRLYSEIVVDSPLAPPFDVTDLRATHGIRVLAGVEVSGANGNFGIGRISGAAPAPRRLRTGGAGGTPHGGDAEFLALYEMPARHTRIGYGGVAGAILDDLTDLLRVAGCLGADPRECFEEILDDLREDPFGEREDAPADLLNLLTSLPDGRRGASGIWNGAPAHWFRIPSGVVSDNLRWVRQFGPGSGGGGGGQSGILFGDPGTRLGGGAGGEGGGALRLLSGRGLHLGAPIKANGGRGGNGAQRRADGVTLSAGGGGGGGAGAIRVLAGEAVGIAGGATEARGGRVGFGGIATRREGIGFGLAAELPYSEDRETPEGLNVVAGALFDEVQFRNSVVSSGVFTLEPRRAPEFFAFDGGAGLALDPNRPHIVVRGPAGVEPRRCYFHPVGDPAQPGFRVNLILFPGANEIVLGGADEELLNRHVVFLSGPDTDGDHLSDADEVARGMNPADTDTDGDGLGDYEELVNGGNPTRADSDGDLLPDDVEIALGTLPTNPDSDADGLWDSLEVYRNQSPTEGRSSAFSYTDGELFAVVDNEAGEKLLALLDPNTGRLGALGRLPRNRGDGITFDPRGTLYLAQGDELFEWAGSVLAPHGTPPAGPVRGISSGGPGSSGGGVVGFVPGTIPSVPAGAGNWVRDFRTLVNADGTLKFNQRGNLRSENALGAFTLPVQAGPLTYDPTPLMGNRISGVVTTPGVAGQSFHLDFLNPIEPPLVRVFLPAAQAPAAIKSLAFHWPTGPFALRAGAAGASDVLQQVDPYNGGAFGRAYPLGRADGLALINVDTNRFIATTASREVLAVELHPAAGTETVTPLSRTVAPALRLARVPCVGGCFNPNPITGTGPLGPNFNAHGFTQGEFNGDGVPDLAVVGEEGQDAVIHILHGDGDGRFNAVMRHVLGQGQVYAQGKLVLGHLDGDAQHDLAAAWVFSTFFGRQGHLAVLKGTADGKFATPLDYALAPPPEGFALGQFDGQHHDDLAFAQGHAFLVPSDAAGTLNFAGASQLQPANFDTQLVEFADLDGDGRKDLIRLGEILSTHANNELTAGWSLTAGFGGADVMELGDHDADGKADLFVSGYSGFVRVFPGNGDLTFDPSFQAFSGQMVGSIPQFAVGDLDGDGRSEIVMPDLHGQRAMKLLWNPLRNSYDLFEEFALSTQPIAARIADLTGDGKLDLVLLGVAGSVEVVLGR